MTEPQSKNFTLGIRSSLHRALDHLCVLIYSQERIVSALERSINKAKLSRLKSRLKSCGKELRVQFPVTITEPHLVVVGDHVSFAAYVHIWGGGGVTIGSRVMIGTHTSITSLTHDYQRDNMYETLVRRPVIIGDDAWIASNCVILPGVSIGRGVVIGAGTVVTKDIPPNSIIYGVPAQIHKER
jgi:maltose O-acetyltransferase